MGLGSEDSSPTLLVVMNPVFGRASGVTCCTWRLGSRETLSAMRRIALSGWPTLLVFTGLGVGIIAAIAAPRPYRLERLADVLPMLTVILLTAAVVPAAIQLSARRAPARWFVLTVATVTCLLLAETFEALSRADWGGGRTWLIGFAALPSLLGFLGWQIGATFGHGWMRTGLIWLVTTALLMIAFPGLTRPGWWWSVGAVAALGLGLRAIATRRATITS